jgi:type II secretory pathway pseudopilin PulG
MLNARTRSRQRGYSLAEALVVLTIIGLVTGVTVPFFMNYLRSNRIRSSAMYFQTAIRFARQRAVTKRIQTRLSFDPAARPGRYTIWEASYNATTGALSGWTAVQPKDRFLDQGVYFANDGSQPVGDGYDSTGSAIVHTDSRPDIIFNLDGSAVNSADTTKPPGTLWLKTDFTSVVNNRYSFQLLSVGTMNVAASHG